LKKEHGFNGWDTDKKDLFKIRVPSIKSVFLFQSKNQKSPSTIAAEEDIPKTDYILHSAGVPENIIS
jgi:hypothetical protein